MSYDTNSGAAIITHSRKKGEEVIIWIWEKSKIFSEVDELELSVKSEHADPCKQMRICIYWNLETGAIIELYVKMLLSYLDNSFEEAISDCQTNKQHETINAKSSMWTSWNASAKTLEASIMHWTD